MRQRLLGAVMLLVGSGSVAAQESPPSTPLPIQRLQPQAREAAPASRCEEARAQYRLAQGMLHVEPGLVAAQKRQMQQACAGQPTP